MAMGANPFAPIVPCHRVLAARGGAGGFSAPGGRHTKLQLLQLEGARFEWLPGQPGLF
jgi:methylated-DNA-[protein]-cysteine S-methyltransferase